jgi:hypothetical protein
MKIFPLIVSIFISITAGAQTFEQIHDSITKIYKTQFDSLAFEVEKIKLSRIDTYEVRRITDPNLIEEYVYEKYYGDSAGLHKLECFRKKTSMTVIYFSLGKTFKAIKFDKRGKTKEYYYPPNFKTSQGALKAMIEVPFSESEDYVNLFHTVKNPSDSILIRDRSNAHQSVPYTIIIDSLIYANLIAVNRPDFSIEDTIAGYPARATCYSNPNNGKLLKVELNPITVKSSTAESWIFYFLNDALVKFRYSFSYDKTVVWNTVYFRNGEVIYHSSPPRHGGTSEMYLKPARELLTIYKKNTRSH